MIKLRNIHKTYDNGTPLHVLKGLDLDVGKGEMIAIMGQSGSGKSTLLNILGILDNYDEGSYMLDGKLIKNLTENEAAMLRNEKMGFIFQSFNLISYKNAVENVALPLYYRGVSRRQRNKKAMELLDKLGLADWAGHKPNEMSGGQKQRVAIARALITTSQEVMDLLKDVNKNMGITIVCVTHERSIAEQTGRVVHIKDGLVDEGAY